MPARIDPELDRFTTEWRQNVMHRFDVIEQELKEIKATMSTNTFAMELEKRVRQLEDFKIKTLGMFAVVQVIFMLLWALMIKIIKI